MPIVRQRYVQDYTNDKWGLNGINGNLTLTHDNGHVWAIIIYMSEHAPTIYASYPAYRALTDLGNKAGIPVIVCRYTEDDTRWRAVPLNPKAREYIPNRTEYDEAGWVKELYRMRGEEVSDEVLHGMNIEI